MPATTNQNNTQGNTAGNSMEQLQMEAVIMQHNPERGVLASADVKIGGFMTIRNVRIKGEEMAAYNVITIGDDLLRAKAMAVRRFDARLHRMLDDMAETMYEFDGVGLAAPQIGISKQIVVIDVGDGLVELVNPHIVEKSGNVLGLEGCLSVPERQGYVYRAQRVLVQAQDRFGEPLEIEAENYFARACQHEIDHLNGILYVDKLANPSEEELAELEEE